MKKNANFVCERVLYICQQTFSLMKNRKTTYHALRLTDTYTHLNIVLSIFRLKIKPIINKLVDIIQI